MSTWTEKWTPQPETDIDRMGAELSVQINCPVRWCGWHWEKPMFECKHGVAFATFLVRGAQGDGDWSLVLEQHRDGLKE